MSEIVADHPEIRWVEATGYPSYLQEPLFYCYHCGEEIVGTVYEDEDYSLLCEDCLLKLHEKDLSGWL